ncbi:hypothetical protein AMK28_10650 [Streptomyces sp. CB02115]|nr:hypothetical protein AMK28_10650 [Streptomyces sp. CB02115]
MPGGQGGQLTGCVGGDVLGGGAHRGRRSCCLAHHERSLSTEAGGGIWGGAAEGRNDTVPWGRPRWDGTVSS